MEGHRESADDVGGEGEPPVELITASLPDLTYGLESGRVVRVTSFEGVTPVPGSATAVDGVTEIDGRVTVVVDAARLLGGQGREPTETDELIVLDRDEQRSIGLRTPRGVGVETVPASRFEQPSAADPAASSPVPSDGGGLDDALLRAAVTPAEPAEPPRLVLDAAGIAAAVES
ncbi:chemotaxis protein CheW [Natrinema longum]|uniref:Chemotaxis protein CheW n=1 Tax=Natrinema longum TaxID=370324 RepID=A0A8A2U5P1_9EURY|nr:chemotaxis protein CheW [Natrinema longum]MBZ6494599.1 chemotaxis protein CheW [Natrinema longum]QSW84081.1 chemotaxis protein CheW [Natrinema longum]